MWIIRKGDKLFHKHYELNKDSIFFDVGGHLGGFTDKILAIYNCKSYIFEPHPEQYIQLAKKYSNNDRVQVFDYGLGGVNKEVYLTDEEGSSEVTQNETNIRIKIKDIVSVMNQLNIEYIDLLKLNIEGSEYELLESLISSNNLDKIKYLQIQFHENVNNAVIKRNEIIKEMRKTHFNKWTYYFVWERWDRKE